jgi:thiamine-monophosphate kinase
VRLDRVPVAASAREAARALGGDAREWAVSGGEDYELLLTCDPAAADRLVAGLVEATGTALTVIGRIEGAGGEPVFVDADGAPVAVRGGFEHFHG